MQMKRTEIDDLFRKDQMENRFFFAVSFHHAKWRRKWNDCFASGRERTHVNIKTQNRKTETEKKMSNDV